MNILVCVKQVPESDAPIEIDETGRWFRPKRPDAFRMNRFDEFAVEEALQIKSRFPATRVDAVSFGPRRVGLTLRRAMGMGADCAIHLLMPDTGNCSPLTVARAISAYARGKNYGLILTGVMAEDDMQGQVGPMLGELLDMPCATSVIAQRLDLDAGSIYAEREIEGGYRHSLRLTLPAVLTVQAGMNGPRYPSLSHVLRSKEVDVETIDVHALSLAEPGEWVEKVEYPQRSRGCDTLEGTPQEKVHRLVEILKKKSFI